MKNLEQPIIHEIRGAESGPSLAVIVGVHGNEKGPQLEWDWLTSLCISRGTLYAIFANPTAANQNIRFVNANLNRRFGLNNSDFPEDGLARVIEEALDRCDASLDLHMYNEDMEAPFVICSQASNELAKLLPAQYIINLPDTSGGGTDDYMTTIGKVGVCFETGSVNRPKAYSVVIQEGVKRFLSHYGLIDYGFVTTSEPEVLVQKVTKKVESADISFSKQYASFDPVEAGEIICTEAGVAVSSPVSGRILFPRPHNPIGAEAYYILADKSK